MLPLLLRGKVTVVAVGVGHAHALGKSPGTGSIEAVKVTARIAQTIVELRAQIIVDQTHPGIPIATVARGLSEVLAEDHGIVTGHFVLENGITMIGIDEATSPVELPLNTTEVAGIAVVFVGSGLLSEKVVRHVLYRVETESVSLGAINLPTCRANQVSADVLQESSAVGEDVFACLEADFFISRSGAQFGPCLVDQDTEVSHVTIFVFVILTRALEVADVGVFRMGGAFGRAMVGVGRFVGNVDEVGQAEVEHLPAAAPIAGIVPLAVEAVLGFAEVEIFRHHAGVKLGLPLAADRGVFVETRDVEGPVVHDVVEINAEPEAVGHCNHVPQISFCAVAGPHRVALVFGAKVERIPQIVTNGETAGRLSRRGEPEGCVAGFGQFRHFLGNLGP